MKHLTTARDILAGIPALKVMDCAPVYETDPVDVKPEHEDKLYLNTIVLILSNLPPDEMREIIRGIEDDEGRLRSEDRNAPRPIDIDVIYAGRLTLDQDTMRIPHPRWASRRFVVQPLADVRPGLLLPGETRTVQEILERLPTEPKATIYREKW
jgi:2-amino-4-hydroxy-6-hydroxymethyldihydropteridine diphosphokinase